MMFSTFQRNRHGGLGGDTPEKVITATLLKGTDKIKS